MMPKRSAKGYSKLTGTAICSYSQVVPFTMTEEKNTGTNLPAQIDLYATQGNKYEFLFITKGGGSANKTFLYQQTKALLNEETLTKFIQQKVLDLGTSACPPYHLAVVIGRHFGRSLSDHSQESLGRLLRSSPHFG